MPSGQSIEQLVTHSWRRLAAKLEFGESVLGIGAYVENIFFRFCIKRYGLFDLEVLMKGKRIFYSELAYFIGIFVLALGTAFMEKADFGISMVVAPAYLIYLKVSEYVPFFSFGMSEYVFQAFLLN